MEQKIKKTVHFRRAVEMTGTGATLQESLEQCKSGYPKSGYPKYNFRSGIDAIIVKHNNESDKCFLHIVTFEENAGTAVVETLEQLGVAEHPAPRAKQYILSQVYLLCRDDNIIFISHNRWLRDIAVFLLLKKLIASFSKSKTAADYKPVAVVDEDRVNKYLSKGVKSIDLNVGGYRPTLEYIANKGRMEKPPLLSALGSFTTDDLTPEKLRAAEKVMSHLTLKAGRNWDNLHVKNLMTKIATDVFSENHTDRSTDGFSIITKDGFRITQEDIMIKQQVELDGNRRIIGTAQVQESLSDAFDNLLVMGVLEE